LEAAKNGRSLEAELRALLERTYAPAKAGRAARIRAMTSKEFVRHMVKVANGAGEGVFHESEGEFREFSF
jgi:plasmid stability protein